MTDEAFKIALLQAGFKTKREFGDKLGLHFNTTSQWGKKNPYPSWLPFLLECAVKARKYDELMSENRA